MSRLFVDGKRKKMIYVLILVINKEDNTMIDIIKKLSWKHLLLAAALLFAYSVCDGLVERVASHASVLGLVCNLGLMVGWSKWGKPIFTKALNKGLGKAEEPEAAEATATENGETTTGEAEA